MKSLIDSRYSNYIKRTMDELVVAWKTAEETSYKRVSKMFISFILTLAGFWITTNLQIFWQSHVQLRALDLRSIFVIIVSYLGGSSIGLFAAILAGTSLFLNDFSNIQHFTDYLYDMNRLIPHINYILLAMIFGYAKRMKREEKEQMSTEINDLSREYADLKTVYSDTLEAKKVLQEQLFNIENSLGSVLKMVEKLNSTESDQVIDSAIGVLENTLCVSRVAIYSLSGENKDCARLLAFSDEFSDVQATINLSDFQEMHKAVSNGSFYIDSNLSGDVCCAYPLIRDCVPAYLVTICEYSPHQFTIAFQNKFIVVCNLIKISLLRSLQYEEVTMGSKGAVI